MSFLDPKIASAAILLKASLAWKLGSMVNVTAMTKEEARAYMKEKYGEDAKANWTAAEIKERIQQHRREHPDKGRSLG